MPKIARIIEFPCGKLDVSHGYRYILLDWRVGPRIGDNGAGWRQLLIEGTALYSPAKRWISSNWRMVRARLHPDKLSITFRRTFDSGG